MQATIDQVREATTALEPVKDKFDRGDTSLTPSEISAFTKAFDTWQGYLEASH